MSIARSHLTRALHLAVLLTVVDQLLTSLVMERPLPGEDPDWPFALHEQVGLVGLGVLVLFWLWMLIRDERETPLQRIFPWFSAEGLGALAADIQAIVQAIAALRTPPLRLDALSSAVHGLGMLLATFLAMSGALWFALFTGTPYGRIVLMAHKLAGNVMWAYLIAHASAALAHEACGDRIFARMFWVRRRRGAQSAPAE
jgi:cytochrome b561